jgi:hypothetical protein
MMFYAGDTTFVMIGYFGTNWSFGFWIWIALAKAIGKYSHSM